nr:immunoglobulin heavy chain junction region [Mus musculus]
CARSGSYGNYPLWYFDVW